MHVDKPVLVRRLRKRRAWGLRLDAAVVASAAPVSVAETADEAAPESDDAPNATGASEPASDSDAPVETVETPPNCSVS